MIEAFVGKGGVGKTSIASAYALLCAERGKTLIVSTDFMPSLKYLLPEDEANLEVVEISEGDISRDWISTYGDQVFSILSEFVDADRSILEHIANSPGVTEEFMISRIVELDKAGKYDYIIWDTPASSSTMHLLALEREFYDHLDRDIRFYLLMKDKFRLSKTQKILKEWQQLANNVWKHLEGTAFYLVSTADELSLVQARQIEEEFRKMGLSISGSILNRSDEVAAREYDARIPEIKGSARDIVERMKAHLAPMFSVNRRS